MLARHVVAYADGAVRKSALFEELLALAVEAKDRLLRLLASPCVAGD
jgi:hypothetical protein